MILMLSRLAAKAQDYISTTNTTARGSITYNSTSLGAFTILDNYVAFQGTSVTNLVPSVGFQFAFDSGWLAAAVATTNVTITDNDGLVSSSVPFMTLFFPNPTNFLSTLFIDTITSSNMPVSLSITNLGSDVYRFTGSVGGTNLDYSLTIAGVLAAGTNYFTASVAYKTGTEILVEKLTSSTYVVSVPEPDGGLLLIGGIAGMMLLRARRLWSWSKSPSATPAHVSVGL